MRFASALARSERTDEALEELADSLRRQMRGEIDLLAVFVTEEHLNRVGAIPLLLRRNLAPRLLIGCTCEGVIAGDREIEREPGIAALAAHLPNVTLTPYYIGAEEWQDIQSGDAVERLRGVLGVQETERDATRALLTLADPFSTPILDLLELQDAACPGAPTIGGMASSAQHPGGNALFLNNAVYDSGAVGVRMSGAVRVTTVVSQGCRPIGERMLITRAEGNMILTLGGRPAFDTVMETLQALPPEDQELIENGLYVGIVINEYQESFERGDFLVRSVLGADPSARAVVIGDAIRAGQTVQFHVRDAASADEDLRLMLRKAAQEETTPAGGLLFSCNGRGLRMFDLPNHDVRCVLEAEPETPIAGFFAAGEFGPVGGRSFIHGQTASVALFRPE